ncbi:phosphoglycerate mutase 2 [Anabrus simplex]|uniref:phosphoglycerate mutase 2 n=1 Tax=Anabrus simplex TaxID=316456 RepID=UPI0035A3201D
MSSKKIAKYTVVLARHGESEWNKDNLFCGWCDVNLSEKGLQEAKETGQAILKAGYKFDAAHTSLLKRAHQTLEIVLKEIGQPELPIFESWRLNERHYGALTGFNKAQTAEKYGLEQVQIWRRSYDVPPPPMDEDHKYYKEIVENPKFAKCGLKKEDIPLTESLKLTLQRVVPYWDDVIVPQMKEGKQILIVGHGTSLRGLVKHMDKMSDEEIMKLNLPTGIPFVYQFDENIVPLVSMQFLSDPETVRKAMEKTAGIGK